MQFFVRKAEERVLFIGDLHEPFTLKKYLAFCAEIRDKYKTNKTVLAGDIIDNHYTSFHETDPDGHSAGAELEKAKRHILKWYKEFPEAFVCLGNHDLIPNRKAFSNGISKQWIKDISVVLQTPNWIYKEEFLFNDVLYTHGNGRQARARMKQDLISVAQGHWHSDSYIEFAAGLKYLLFALQVGSGIDKDSFAAAYGKNFKKPQINVGVILENGRLPIIEHMNL